MSTLIHEDTNNIQLCLEGNADAFEPLVRRYQNAAFAVALGYLRNRADAEDVVQEAFVAAFCKLSQLKDPAVFSSWFHRIVVNRCKEWVRKSKVGLQVRVDTDSGRIGDDYSSADQAHTRYIESLELWDEVEKLPEHYRNVVTLYYYTGFSQKEIAAFLDIPESTARGRLYQSRIRLRKALSPQEKETIIMSQIDVTEEVQDVVCRIAKEDFEETIDMGDLENIVLYCGVSTEVEIKQAQGERVVVEGSKIALGLTEEEAQSNVNGFKVSCDTVDDFYSSGPHDGELFVGVQQNRNEKRAVTEKSSESWKHDLMNNWVLDEVRTGLRLVDLFPDLQGDIDVFPPLPEPTRIGLSRSIRISVHTSEVRPIEISRESLSADAKELFHIYNSDGDNVFGPTVYCHLTISVPADKNISVFKARTVTAENTNNSLMIYSCQSCALFDIGRDVYLINSTFSEIRRIEGLVYQRMYDYGGGSYRDGMLRNSDLWEGTIESVKGDVDIDVGRIVLEAADLEGNVSIYNRYGSTRLRQSVRKSDVHCCMRTVSGNLFLALDEPLAKRASLEMHSLCGSIKYGEAKDIMRLYWTQNNAHRLTIASNFEFETADFRLLTESGTAEIEVMKNGKHN
ncbi:MAG: sigma-70 family RNA polymerase sigma factor [Gammaproteobacteria bacterium]|nr:sigma-70 family RNA polymerase sigma factor [Gammaproteobacteria bacterium]